LRVRVNGSVMSSSKKQLIGMLYCEILFVIDVELGLLGLV